MQHAWGHKLYRLRLECPFCLLPILCLRLDFHLREIFCCRKFSLRFFSILSDHAELSYFGAQNSKESMQNISPANNFSGSINQP